MFIKLVRPRRTASLLISVLLPGLLLMSGAATSVAPESSAAKEQASSGVAEQRSSPLDPAVFAHGVRTPMRRGSDRMVTSRSVEREAAKQAPDLNTAEASIRFSSPATPPSNTQSIPAVAQARTITYAYDGAGRLTSADYGNGASITYGYDAAGNLTGAGGPPPPPPPAIASASFDGANKLVINGANFGDNPSVFINGVDKTPRIRSADSSRIVLKKKLGLEVPGSNLVEVLTPSGTASFNLVL